MKATLLLPLLFLSAAVANEPAKPETDSVKPPCCRVIAPGRTHTDRSLYQLDSTWTSDVGKPVKLAVLQGRIQVVAMFFANCEFACPITVHDLKAIQAALPESLRDRVEFLLVSFDPERDTVAALKTYRQKHGLDITHWSLLRGENDDVRELAALLGINYKRDARGQFAHSNVITLLNEQGEIVHQQPGLNHQPIEMIKLIEKHLAAPSLSKSK